MELIDSVQATMRADQRHFKTDKPIGHDRTPVQKIAISRVTATRLNGDLSCGSAGDRESRPYGGARELVPRQSVTSPARMQRIYS